MRPLAAAAVALLILPAAATASHNGAPTLDHYVQLGEGFLIANPAGHEVVRERSPAPAACAPYDDGDGRANELKAGARSRSAAGSREGRRGWHSPAPRPGGCGPAPSASA
jgi:hypothetical protein